MENKVLSVSIAAYNVEKTLEEVLTPFCNVKNKEILDVMIIDDGSKDRTREIASKYVKKYPDMFRLIEKENGGWGSTLNVGFREARGKYFKQLDGDDFFSPENLDDFLEYMKNADADMVYSPFVLFEDKTNAIISVRDACSSFERDNIYYLDEIQAFIPNMHSIAVKVDILRKNNISITEHCFYTDVEFLIKAYNCCETMLYYEKPVYYYRTASKGQSMSTSSLKRNYKDHEKMLFTMLDYYNNNVHEEEKKNNIKNRIIDVCNMQYGIYCVLPQNTKHKKDFMNLDAKLKKYPEFYDSVKGRFIALLRKLDFAGYTIIAKLKTSRDRKNKWNAFAG